MPKVKVLLSLLTTIVIISSVLSPVFAQDITSTNFIIKGDTVSSGETSGTSPSFLLTGEVNPFSDLSSSSNYKLNLGYNPRLQAFVPSAPVLENVDSNLYDRLLLTLDPTGNPADTLFAIQVLDITNTLVYYVQNDNSISTTLGVEDYKSFANWGGVSGFNILGLSNNTEYQVRVKAINGDFTETAYSPLSVAVTTTVPFVNFTVSESEVHFGVLSANAISTTSTVDVIVTTNSVAGYQTYVNGTGDGVLGGLYGGPSKLIASDDTILSSGIEGYGVQVSSATANLDSKYDLSGNNVGEIAVSINPLASNTIDVDSEVLTLLFKVSIANNTEAGNYTDTIYYTITSIL